MDGNLRHMNKTTQQLPNYIKRNLMNMPNNKGYIHKGVWFLGYQHTNNYKVRLMFEKVDNNTLRIHKITQKFWIVSEKDQRTKKVVIISKEKRDPIFESIFEKIGK